MNKFKFLSFSLFLLLLSASYSSAVVLVQDDNSEAEGGLATSGPIVTGTGQAGNYVLLACSTTSDGANQFVDPAPGDWTSIIQEDCASNSCILGVWGRFVDTADSENITCSWSEPQNVFTAGTIRYSGVNTQEPIIDNIACSQGSGNIATAPSIVAFSKSQVVRIAGGTQVEDNNEGGVAPENLVLDGGESGFFSGTSFFMGDTGAIEGISELLFTSGPTGTFDIELNNSVDRWVACTLAIQMEATTIPTLSEWGFIAVAAFLGISGVWFLRRKQAANA
jgi:exosortase sorting signal-containing protein